MIFNILCKFSTLKNWDIFYFSNVKKYSPIAPGAHLPGMCCRHWDFISKTQMKFNCHWRNPRIPGERENFCWSLCFHYRVLSMNNRNLEEISSIRKKTLLVVPMARKSDYIKSLECRSELSMFSGACSEITSIIIFFRNTLSKMVKNWTLRKFSAALLFLKNPLK